MEAEMSEQRKPHAHWWLWSIWWTSSDSVKWECQEGGLDRQVQILRVFKCHTKELILKVWRSLQHVEQESTYRKGRSDGRVEVPLGLGVGKNVAFSTWTSVAFLLGLCLQSYCVRNAVHAGGGGYFDWGILWEPWMDKMTLVIAPWCGTGPESVAFCCVRIRKGSREFGGLARMAGLIGLLSGTLPASPSLFYTVTWQTSFHPSERPQRWELLVLFPFPG